jgi:hypothetical protein
MKKIQFPKIDKKQGLAWYYDRIGGKQIIGHDGSSMSFGRASIQLDDQFIDRWRHFKRIKTER